MIELPLRNGEMHQVSDVEIKMKGQGYPTLDVAQEYWKMQQWCEANPKKRKTATGINRFINHWLSRALDKQRQQALKVNHTPHASHRKFEYEKPKVMSREVGMAALAALKRR